MILNITLDTSSRTFRSVFTVCLFLFSIVLFSAAAYSWTGPASNPPGDNVDAPVNVGGVSQIKDGALGVNGFHNTGSGHTIGSVRADSGFCIGASCITSWPTSSAPAQTTVSASCGLTAGGCTVTTANCPAGYVRSGCSADAQPNGKAFPQGSGACRCSSSTGGTGSASGRATCYTYCVK